MVHNNVKLFDLYYVFHFRERILIKNTFSLLFKTKFKSFNYYMLNYLNILLP